MTPVVRCSCMKVAGGGGVGGTKESSKNVIPKKICPTVHSLVVPLAIVPREKKSKLSSDEHIFTEGGFKKQYHGCFRVK
jgi:hypothetical protein